MLFKKDPIRLGIKLVLLVALLLVVAIEFGFSLYVIMPAVLILGVALGGESSLRNGAQWGTLMIISLFCVLFAITRVFDFAILKAAFTWATWLVDWPIMLPLVVLLW